MKSKSKAIQRVKLKNATGEVSSNAFVHACVAFQQAKNMLREFVAVDDLEQLNIMSQGIYDLVNVSLRKKNKTGPVIRAIKRGDRKPHYANIVSAIKGKGNFTIPDVVSAMEKKGTLPQVDNVAACISTILGQHTNLFHRVERGTYRLKGRHKLILKKKAVAALPAATT